MGLRAARGGMREPWGPWPWEKLPQAPHGRLVAPERVRGAGALLGWVEAATCLDSQTRAGRPQGPYGGGPPKACAGGGFVLLSVPAALGALARVGGGVHACARKVLRLTAAPPAPCCPRAAAEYGTKLQKAFPDGSDSRSAAQPTGDRAAGVCHCSGR